MNLPSPLTAEWRNLLFLNYEVSPELLVPYLPARTELDLWHDRIYMSIVGLMFLDTAIFGIPDPLHQEYEQVNLRFYVRRRIDNGWAHGVVFLKEIVPATLVTAAARLLFNERYVTMDMTHRIEDVGGVLPPESWVEYGWRKSEEWNRISARVSSGADLPEEESRELFVMHRLHGYTKRLDGSTTEYRLDHPVWPIHHVKDARLDCDIAQIFGEMFVEYLSVPPAFSFLATGSHISMINTESV